MSTQIRDMVMETTTTTGVGTIALGGAVPGWATFSSALTDGDVVFYAQRQSGGDWEVCKGTFNTGTPDTLSRDVVLASSNGGAAVNWGAGSRVVYCTLPASQILLAENALAELGVFALLVGNNLSELVGSASTARANLGLSLPLAIASGGTAGTTASGARTNLGLGTAAVLDVGTTANKVVQLDGSAKLPAVDGSQLTGLPSGPIPAGTKMVFAQSSAPSGWTLVTTWNDRVLRVRDTTGVGGTTGGTWVIPGSHFTITTTVDEHTLTASEIPLHRHAGDSGRSFLMNQPGSGSFAFGTGGTGASATNFTDSSVYAPASGTPVGGGGHSHTASSGQGAGDGTWRPAYVDVIVCSKN